MNYRIEWLPETLQQFTASWELLNKHDQRFVMDALDGVDYQLQNQPLAVGESREGPDRRVLVQSPVIVTYDVVSRIGLVTIHDAQIITSQE